MNSTMWGDMFILAVPILEKVVRTIIIYFTLIIGLRLAGKRELAQLNPFDLVVLLTLSNTVQNAIIGNDNSVVGGIVGAATLLILNYGVVRLVTSNQKIDTLIAGSEDVLINAGEVQKEELKHELISPIELEIAAHKQGFDSLNDIERAVLEPGGGISFVGKKPGVTEDRHQQLLDRLDQLATQIQVLRDDMNKKNQAAS